uniref:Secreted protein n=1 Tax=Steinernema glaseri TaxID=37863 RepID=A0A1I7ZQM6_9BILA
MNAWILVFLCLPLLAYAFVLERTPELGEEYKPYPALESPKAPGVEQPAESDSTDEVWEAPESGLDDPIEAIESAAEERFF